jgi:hypothetical protein
MPMQSVFFVRIGYIGYNVLVAILAGVRRRVQAGKLSTYLHMNGTGVRLGLERGRLVLTALLSRFLQIPYP